MLEGSIKLTADQIIFDHGSAGIPRVPRRSIVDSDTGNRRIACGIRLDDKNRGMIIMPFILFTELDPDITGSVTRPTASDSVPNEENTGCQIASCH